MKPTAQFGGRTRQAVVWLIALTVVLGPLHAFAQSRPAEYSVKAVYMFNFGKFTEWPSASIATASVFSICVLGQDPFGEVLDNTLAGEMLKGKRTAARRIALATEAAGCQILFIGNSEERNLRQILAAIEKTPVLTVSDIGDFAQRGGMVQFVLEERRVRFEVNVGAARNAGLTLSSELLRVAKTLHGSPTRGS